MHCVPLFAVSDCLSVFATNVGNLSPFHKTAVLPGWCNLLVSFVVANVFVHHEPVDGAAVESGLDDELSDSEEAEVRQKIIYKIGKL